MHFDLTLAPPLVLLDLVLRTMIIGQFLLLGGLLLREPATAVTRLLLCCGISVAALVMLTAPIPEEQYGLLRNLLLILTDAFAVLFWFLIRYLFDDDFNPSRWPWPIRLLLLISVLPYLYVLGVKAGISPLHDVIHAIGLMLVLHAVYVALSGFSNDLLDTRRRARIQVVLVISVYSMVLVIFEFLDDRFRNAAWFGLLNAAILLLATTTVVYRLFVLHYLPVSLRSSVSASEPDSGQLHQHKNMVLQDHESSQNQALKQALDEFIALKRYQQNALTISELGRQLDCPEHKLRRLINQTLGHRNFNSFLNDLRLSDACDQLADPAQNGTPVLTIALSLGYDSIGPFNRAFKAKTGMTPGEYRRQIQNRR